MFKIWWKRERILMCSNETVKNKSSIERDIIGSLLRETIRSSVSNYKHFHNCASTNFLRVYVYI